MVYNLTMEKEILVIILAYLFGSISWALVIGKLFYNKDIRKEGSGNLGGSNAGRVLGKKAGIVVTILDALKCVLVVYIGSLFSIQIGAICGIAAAIGHCFPIFASFKGGKAVATSAGFILATCLYLGVNWWVFIILFITFFLVLYLTKYVSLSSITTFIVACIVNFILKTDMTIIITNIILTLVIIYRHKDNIKRLIKHSEKKITWM